MKTLSVALALTAGCLWGLSGYFVRGLTALNFGIMEIMFTRMSIACGLMFVFILFKDRTLFKIKPRDILPLAGAGILGTFAFNCFYTVAIQQLTLSLAAILLCTVPVPVMIISHFLFKEVVSVQKAAAAFLTITACFLVSGIFESGAFISAKGIWCGIFSSLCYAVYNIFSRISTNRGYSSTTITFYGFLSITVVTSVFADFDKMASAVETQGSTFIVFMLLHSLLIAVFPYMLYTISLQHLDVGVAAILSSSEPVAAMILGAIMFNEIPSPLNIMGIAIFIFAVILLNQSKNKMPFKRLNKN